MGYAMASGSCFTNQAVVMRALGFMIREAAQVLKSMPIATATRGSIITGNIMGKDFTGGQLMSLMLVTSSMVSDKARESGKRVFRPMLASGLTLGDMDLAC